MEREGHLPSTVGLVAWAQVVCSWSSDFVGRGFPLLMERTSESAVRNRAEKSRVGFDQQDPRRPARKKSAKRRESCIPPANQNPHVLILRAAEGFPEAVGADGAVL